MRIVPSGGRALLYQAQDDDRALAQGPETNKTGPKSASGNIRNGRQRQIAPNVIRRGRSNQPVDRAGRGSADLLSSMSFA